MTSNYVSITMDPRVASGAAVWNGPAVAAIAAGGQHNLLLTKAGTVLASGSNERGQSDVPTELTDVVAIAAGFGHSVALRRDGIVVAWGNNSRGATDVPAGLSDVVGISAGGGHTAALRSDGTVEVWGQLGVGDLNPPAGLSDVVGISSGWESCYAVRRTGSVVAWGQNQFGITSVPEDVVGVVAIACGGGAFPRWVVVNSDGNVEHGQNGRHGGRREGVTSAVDIAAGEMHNLALLRGGGVEGWGTSPVRHTVPSGLRDVVAISAGNDHSLALRTDGTVVAWGKNGYQQILPPRSFTQELVGWQNDGYYLPSLSGTRGTDLYADRPVGDDLRP